MSYLHIFQAGRQIRQYFNSAEWSTSFCNHERGWQEGADRRVWTRRPDWSGKDRNGEGEQMVDSSNFQYLLCVHYVKLFFHFYYADKY